MSATDLTEALEALTGSSRYGGKLPDPKPRGEASAVQSTAVLGSSGKDQGSGGSIASPLTETSYAARTWWNAKNVRSSDGLFTISQRCLKSVTMTDANGKTVVMNFKDSP